MIDALWPSFAVLGILLIINYFIPSEYMKKGDK